MLKILWKRGKIAPQEQFLPLSTIFYYLMLDFYVITGVRFSLRDKRLFEITEVEITRVDSILNACGSISFIFYFLIVYFRIYILNVCEFISFISSLYTIYLKIHTGTGDSILACV